MSVAFLASRVRPEEKLLLAAYAARGVDVLRVDDRSLALRVDEPALPPGFDGVEVLHDRSIAFGTSVHVVEALERVGVACVNRSAVIRACGDKLRASLALAAASVPQPETRVAFSPEEALRVLDGELGYPAVLKPTVGSWGRLVARLNDRDAAEAVLEDRATLGGWTHRTIYLQRLVDKPGSDVRVFVVGDEPIAAIRRHSEHWITNTARGARTSACEAGGELGMLAVDAARAVGGGVLAVDIVEDPVRGPLVLEVNHSCEFRNSIDVTGVDIPGAIVDFVLAQRLAQRVARPVEVAP